MLLCSRGGATGAGEAVGKVTDDAETAEGINGVNPGVGSAETKQEPF